MTAEFFRKSAKGLLKGYWVRSITAVMLSIAASAIASVVAEMVLTLTETDLESAVGYAILLFGSAVGTFLSAPVLLGYRRILWLRAEGKTPSLAEVLYLFGEGKALWRYVRFYLLRSLLTLLPAAVLTAPVIVCVNVFELDGFDINAPLNNMAPLTAMLALCCVLLVLLGLGLTALQALRYMLSDYIFIEKGEDGVMSVLRTSSQLCVKHAKLLISLFFSFIPWFLLNATGFGRLFTVPYFSGALACAAKQFLAEEEPCSQPDATVTFDSAAQGEQV